jgi:hypothetical protein
MKKQLFKETFESSNLLLKFINDNEISQSDVQHIDYAMTITLLYWSVPG